MKTIPTKLSYLIETPHISDEGSLIVTEGKKHLPFHIKRAYYIMNVQKNARRGYHAHKKCLQVLFCIKGRIKIILDDGNDKEELILDQANQGIFLDKLMWHEMWEFEEDTVLLIFASDYYKEADYIRDYNEFLKIVRRNSGKESFVARVKSLEKQMSS